MRAVFTALAVMLAACSSDPAHTEPTATGGTSGNTGGQISTGGASATGGAATGGAATGGAATGGASSTGGADAGTGVTGTGGVTADGGPQVLWSLPTKVDYVTTGVWVSGGDFTATPTLKCDSQIAPMPGRWFRETDTPTVSWSYADSSPQFRQCMLSGDASAILATEVMFSCLTCGSPPFPPPIAGAGVAPDLAGHTVTQFALRFTRFVYEPGATAGTLHIVVDLSWEIWGY